MDLSDIFSGNTKPSTTVTSIDAINHHGTTTCDLKQKALTAAEAYDKLKAKRFYYEQLKLELLEKLELELGDRKSELVLAQNEYEALALELRDIMGNSGVAEITLDDRAPIYCKKVAGRKKPITKKWLTEELGKEAGKELWNKAPNHPDEIQIVIPDRYNDQPTD